MPNTPWFKYVLDVFLVSMHTVHTVEVKNTLLFKNVSLLNGKNYCKYFLPINGGTAGLRRLFVSVPASALSGPTISLLMKVQDNYIPSVSQPEEQNASEIAEQNAFLDAIMDTQVMKLAEAFLHSKSEFYHTNLNHILPKLFHLDNN